ncbi:MAG: Electron transfer flavoprotein subunit alpha [Firmicutes bacterium ADurb.Bin248]|nr:MAG: Electron transfer flavoprotein subunit alpha [Firmicutes bacterium ADurb.Bin248]
MNILVLFKTVPVWERVLERDWEAFSPYGDLSYAGKEINCFDEAALELGLRLRDEYAEQGKEARCFAATAGTPHPSFAQTLFAAGYEDVAVLGAGEFEFASEEVARLLADYAAGGDCGLILAGAAAGMADTGTVPLRVAQKLGRTFITNALELRARGDAVELLCQEPDGLYRRVVRAPLLASVSNSPAVLRAATLRARLAVRDRQARTVWGDKTFDGGTENIIFSRSAGKRVCGLLEFTSVPGLAKTLLEHELSGKASARAAQSRAFCPPNAVVYDTQNILWYAAEPAFGPLRANWHAGKPDYALFADTYTGRALAYRLARETGAFFLTGALFAEDGESLFRRACASNVLARYRPRLPAVLTMEKLPVEAERVSLETADEKPPFWLLEEEKKACANDGLRNKKAVVVCGAGMGSRANCERARELARKLGAGFGLTRAAALNGWGGPGEIVGQSGASISPEICLVLGASGAGAFAAGIENAARVVAVNSDEKALIFRHADAGAVADAPALTEALLAAASCAAR